MIYIIQTQRNRDVNEILYDHNHENVSSTLKYGEEEVSYRRMELIMRRMMVGFLLVCQFFFLCLHVFSRYETINFYFWIVVPFYSFILVLLLGVSAKLLWLMMKLHRYEYYIHRRHMIMYTAMMSVQISFHLYRESVRVRFFDKLNFKHMETYEEMTIAQIKEACATS